MEQNKLDRINALARKSRAEGLSPEEKAEQAKLRQEYVAAFRASMTDILEHTYLQRPDGELEKLQRREEPEKPLN